MLSLWGLAEVRTRLVIVQLRSSTTLEPNQEYKPSFWGGWRPCVFSGGDNLGGRLSLSWKTVSCLQPTWTSATLWPRSRSSVPAFGLSLVLALMQMKHMDSNDTLSSMPLPVGWWGRVAVVFSTGLTPFYFEVVEWRIWSEFQLPHLLVDAPFTSTVLEIIICHLSTRKDQ